MDKNLACHSIALEVAKAYIDSNLPEYKIASGLDSMAKDMAQKYLDAYITAAKIFDEPRNKAKEKAIPF